MMRSPRPTLLLRESADERVVAGESRAPANSTNAAQPEAVDSRKRPLDNPRVIGVAVGLLIAVLAGLVWLSERTGTGEIVSPLLSDVLLYVLYAVDLTIL